MPKPTELFCKLCGRYPHTNHIPSLVSLGWYLELLTDKTVKRIMCPVCLARIFRANRALFKMPPDKKQPEEGKYYGNLI